MKPNAIDGSIVVTNGTAYAVEESVIIGKGK